MRILTVQHAVPSHRVTNDELIEHALAHPENQVPGDQHAAFRGALKRFLERCGAVTRHHRAPGERALELGVAAARRALVSAGLSEGDIDLLIYVGVARGFIEPATANVFQAALGLTGATCFDLLDACASWIRALDVAHHFLRLGTYHRAMILNCECNFAEFVRFDFGSSDDLTHLGAGLTVGEAATATVVEDIGDVSPYYSTFRTRGAHHGLCAIPLPGVHQFSNNGATSHPPVRFYAYAGSLHQAAIHQLAAHYRSDSRLTSYTPDIIFGHSPSVPAAQNTLKAMGLDSSRFVDPFPRFGNTVSACVPLAMSVAVEEGRLQRGQQVLIGVASAGVTTAFCRFTY